MNNEKNENPNNNKQINFIKVNNSPVFKINILKPIENETKKESSNINNQKNRLCLSPVVKRRKSKNMDNLKLMLQNSFRSKCGKSDKEKEEKEEKEESEVVKKNNIRYSQNFIKSQINNEECNPVITKKKSFLDIKSQQTNKSNKKSEISSNKMNKKSPPKNNNDYNDDEIINLFHFANNLYQNDEHLSKNIISKKIDTNDLSKEKSFINAGRTNSFHQKKKLVVNFGVNEQESQIIKHLIKENEKKSNEENIKTDSKVKQFSSIKEKNTFSNFLQSTPKLKTPIKNKGDETNKDNQLKKALNLNEKRKISGLQNLEGDMTDKNSKIKFGKVRTFKNKMSCDLDKKFEESNKKKINKINSPKANKKKRKRGDSINSFKNKTNELDNLKKEKEDTQNQEININKIKKKKKICLFCCFN